MNRVIDLLQRYPIEVALIAFFGLMGFFAVAWVLRVRFGFPMLMFACVFLILAGASSWGQLQVFCKGSLRWASLGCMSAWVVLVLRFSPLPQNRYSSLHIGVLLLLFAAALTVPFSSNPQFAALSAMAALTMFVAALGSAWYFTTSPQRLIELVDVLARLALVVVFGGFLFAVAPRVSAFAGGRFRGFFNNPNWSGNFAAIMLPIILWKIRYPRDRIEKFVAVVLACAIGINVIWSGSRGAIVGAVIAGVLAQIRLDRARFMRKLAIIVPLLILVLLTQVGREYFGSRASGIARTERLATLTHRTEMWRAAWPTIRESLPVGMGLGNSRFILMDESDVASAAKVGGTAAHLHSQHILMLAELGFLGLFLLWAFMIATVYMAIKSWALPLGPLSDLTIILACSCIVVFGDSFLHGWMLSAGSAFALMFWIIVCLMIKSRRFACAEIAAASAQSYANSLIDTSSGKHE
jgi:O-antigen ligase